MKILIDKCPVPIIWVDTSVVIRLTKLREGESLSSDLEKLRYTQLIELLYQKARDRRLICPKGDQEEEILIGRRLVDECRETQITLSQGVKFNHRSEIERNQMCTMMKAYITKSEIIEFSYSEAFRKNPLDILNSKDRFIVSDYYQWSEDTIMEMEEAKKRTLQQIESIRENNVTQGRTYEQQLQEEYKGFMKAMLSVLANWYGKISNGGVPSYDDYSRFEFFSIPLMAWDRYGGDPPGVDGFSKFIESEYYRETPEVDISARLYATILTSPNEVESGDSMDISQVSTVLPYCHYVLTDRKMKNRIQELGIDRKYNTKVYCMREFDDLMNELQRL